MNIFEMIQTECDFMPNNFLDAGIRVEACESKIYNLLTLMSKI